MQDLCGSQIQIQMADADCSAAGVGGRRLGRRRRLGKTLTFSWFQAIILMVTKARYTVRSSDSRDMGPTEQKRQLLS